MPDRFELMKPCPERSTHEQAQSTFSQFGFKTCLIADGFYRAGRIYWRHVLDGGFVFHEHQDTADLRRWNFITPLVLNINAVAAVALIISITNLGSTVRSRFLPLSSGSGWRCSWTRKSGSRRVPHHLSKSIALSSLSRPCMGIMTAFALKDSSQMGWKSYSFDWLTNREMSIYAVVIAGVAGHQAVMALMLAGLAALMMKSGGRRASMAFPNGAPTFKLSCP
jgi:hypothetical protein